MDIFLHAYINLLMNAKNIVFIMFEEFCKELNITKLMTVILKKKKEFLKSGYKIVLKARILP